MLKNGKAPGLDGVPTNLVKDAAQLIAKPLMMTFNASLKQGIFQNIWKLAKSHQFTNPGPEMSNVIIDPFQFSRFFQNCLKKLCMINYRTSFSPREN